MYREDYDGANAQERSGEDVYSKPVRAGKRTYFFDVKATKGNDFYLTITESKRKVDNSGHFSYDKHKIFLYKEDFGKFMAGLQQAVQFIADEQGLPEPHQEEKETSAEEPTESLSENEIKIDIDF